MRVLCKGLNLTEQLHGQLHGQLLVGRNYVPPLGALVSTVNEAFGNRPYDREKEPNNTDGSEYKDYFEGDWVQHCTAETEETRAIEEVNHKNN